MSFLKLSTDPSTIPSKQTQSEQSGTEATNNTTTTNDKKDSSAPKLSDYTQIDTTTSYLRLLPHPEPQTPRWARSPSPPRTPGAPFGAIERRRERWRLSAEILTTEQDLLTAEAMMTAIPPEGIVAKDLKALFPQLKMAEFVELVKVVAYNDLEKGLVFRRVRL